MDIIFLIIGIILFIAWAGGIAMKFTSIRSIFTGNQDWKFKLKKPYLIKKKKVA